MFFPVIAVNSFESVDLQQGDVQRNFIMRTSVHFCLYFKESFIRNLSFLEDVFILLLTFFACTCCWKASVCTITSKTDHPSLQIPKITLDEVYFCYRVCAH